MNGEESAFGGGSGDPGGRRRRLKIAGFLLAGVLVVGAGGAGWAFWRLNDNIQSVDIDAALGDNRPAKVRSSPDPSSPDPSASDPAASNPSASNPAASATAEALPSGALNILVLGSDSRSGKENAKLGGGDEGAGARSDTAMVVHIDEGRTGATVVSIPRDTLVTRPSCPLESGGSTAVAYNVMFNSAYAVGGPVCAVKTVESMTDVRMDHYIEIDFSGFAKLVDALGGVMVTTDEDIDDEDSHLSLRAGTHHLDGEQALALARTRHGIGDGSDLGRIGLQQKLVKALLDQISSTDLLTNPAQLYRAADAITGSLTTDTGLDSLTELTRLGESVRGLSSAGTRTVMMPVVTAPYDRNRVVADEPEAGRLWESLR
ncbi:LCP family protein [Streptomyces sp. MB09-02B]|nr:LCP family protein [Streptomyces sp. MB09-02B]MDX3644403.1 LCP family protein [Streptomyces sp. MB09-02B]